MARWDSFKILTKILIICLSMVIPVALPTVLLVQQSQKDVTFGESERHGSTYLGQIWPVLQQLVASGSANNPGLDAALRQWRAAAPSFDAEFNAQAASERLQASFAASDRSLEARVGAVQDLIAKVGDGSNLMLDPDLDSFYVMDTVVDKAPSTLGRAAELVDAISATASKGKQGFDGVATQLKKLGEFNTARAGLDASLEKAIAGNGDQSLMASLGTHRKAMDEATQAFSAVAMRLIRASAEGGVQAAGVAELSTVFATLQRATDAFWTVGNRELDRLLALRIAGFNATLWRSLAAIGFFVVLTGLLVAAVTRSITRPTARLIDAIELMQAGDLAAAIPYTEFKNEIGAFARALIFLRDGVSQRRALDREATERRKIDENRKMLSDMAGTIAEATGRGLDRIVTDARAVETQTGAMRAALQMMEQAIGVARSNSDDALQLSSEAAQLSSGMLSAISEVSGMVARTQATTRKAVDQASQSRDRVADLAQAADDIGSFVGMISGIAEQTNLLALNATIEAARAGAAGRGFAVVASEVKALAAQTSKSTEQISAKVQEIQTRTLSAVDTITVIGTTIEQLSAISSAIDAAMQEQKALTSEFVRILGTVNTSAREVSSQAVTLSSLTAQSIAASSAVGHSAGTMMTSSADMRSDIPAIVEQARQAIERRDSRRTDVQMAVTLVVDGRQSQCETREFSSTGINLMADLPKGKTVELVMPDRSRHAATVIWSSGDRAGLQFVTPLAAAVVDRLLGAPCAMAS